LCCRRPRPGRLCPARPRSGGLGRPRLGGHPARRRVGSWIAAAPGGGSWIPPVTASTSQAGVAAAPAGITSAGI
jgi:hypothetical protein